MRMTDTAGDAGRSGAVPEQLGLDLLPADAQSTMPRATRPTTPVSRTSTTATRTTTTWTTSISSAPSAASPWPSAHADFPLELPVKLHRGWRRCRKSKRNTAAALAFEADHERELVAMRDALLEGSYRPLPSSRFAILNPKVREVWAAQFRDRVVQWTAYLELHEAFHRHFIHDSFACIPGRGTLRAAERLEHHARSCTRNWSRPAFYLKFDVANFFVSIHKPKLFALLAERIPDPWWRELVRLIVFHDPREGHIVRGRPEFLEKVPVHKRLISQDSYYGLAIGNLFSQFSANVYLDVIDQFVKHVLKARYYCRYVDDGVIIDESPQRLNEYRRRIEELLRDPLQLELNPSKTVLQPARRGIDFVGHLIGPHGRQIRRRTARRALHRLRHVKAQDLLAVGNSYFGLFRQAPLSWNDRRRIALVLLDRGQTVNAALTKTYRRAS